MKDAQQKNSLFDLAVCFAILCGTYAAYGVYQEHIMTQPYRGGLLPSPGIIVLANRTVTVVASATMVWFSQQRSVPPGIGWAALPACSVTLSSWCLYSSLQYVSYPTQVMFASSKILPTMLGNVLLNGSTFTWKEYLGAGVVTALVIVIGLEMESEEGHAIRNTFVGYGMLFTYLVSDSFTSNTEKRILRDYEGEISKSHLMLAVSILSLLNILASLTISGSLAPAVTFLLSNHDAAWDIMHLSFISTLGMFMIFHVIQRHGPVVLSVMMTVRQVVSLVLSAWLFNHHISMHMAAMICVLFMAVFSNVILKSMKLGEEYLNASKGETSALLTSVKGLAKGPAPVTNGSPPIPCNGSGHLV